MKIQESLIQATVFLGRSLLVVLPLAAVYVAPPTSAANSEWKLIGGNEYEQHYSPLAQINTNTVRNLKLAWYADMPTRDGLTGIPIVVDGVVYQRHGALGKVWANDVRTGKAPLDFRCRHQVSARCDSLMGFAREPRTHGVGRQGAEGDGRLPTIRPRSQDRR